MSSVVIKGDTSGQVTLTAPAEAGTPTLTLPTTTGTVLLTENFTGSNVSLATNGYQKLPSGLILQWCVGTASSSETSQTVNFPITFPTAVLNVQVTTYAPSTADRMIQTTSWTTSAVTVYLNSIGGAGGNVTPYVFAIGY